MLNIDFGFRAGYQAWFKSHVNSTHSIGRLFVQYLSKEIFCTHIIYTGVNFQCLFFVVIIHNDLNKNSNKVSGELTLLGISKKITLNAVINKIEKYPFGFTKPIVMGVSATASFNRSDFGMNYAVKKNLVGDQIDLIIEFEAIKQ